MIGFVRAVPDGATDVVATPLVKVCGLTRPEDVTLAAGLGAWAVGFVFAASPRRLTPGQAVPLVACARAAALSAGGAPVPLAVGVFVDESPEQIAAIVRACGLDGVQLHGQKPRAAIVRAGLGSLGGEVLVIQAVAVPASGMASEELQKVVATAREGADVLLFDTKSEGRFGGTGALFPWWLARAAAGDTPFLVAGGLGPANVRPALTESGAAGVDVSSGVERSPGVKDPDRLRALFAALHCSPMRSRVGHESSPSHDLEPAEGKVP